MPCIALRNGVPLVMINFDATQYDAFAKGLVRQRAGEFLGAVGKELKRMPVALAAAAPLRRMPNSIAKSQNPDDAKRMRVVKEGSRRGQEISINAKFYGMAFFCT